MWNVVNPEMINMLKSHFRVRCGWKTFTPTVQQGVGVNCSVLRARYYIDDSVATVLVALAVTSAGTANNAIYIVLPEVLRPASVGFLTGAPCGVFGYHDAGTGVYSGFAQHTGDVGGLPSVAGWCGNWNSPSGGVFGTYPNMAAANGDNILLNLNYEVYSSG